MNIVPADINDDYTATKENPGSLENDCLYLDAHNKAVERFVDQIIFYNILWHLCFRDVTENG